MGGAWEQVHQCILSLFKGTMSRDLLSPEFCPILTHRVSYSYAEVISHVVWISGSYPQCAKKTLFLNDGLERYSITFDLAVPMTP